MYRYINFAIANEFMMIANQNGRSISEITRLVNTGYSRGGLASPGLTAGPCLYKDGFFLINSARFPFSDLITTAWRINEGTPDYLIGQLNERRRIRDEKVAILGMSFKKDIDDTRNSLSYRARKIFLAEGAEVHMHDPLVKSESLESVLSNAGIVFVAMNHTLYQNLGLDYLRGVVKPDCTIVDIWNIFKNPKTIFNLGE
jgi:UDP-N-acetyl-D-mannosaminuronic acid dehydrogenase